MIARPRNLVFDCTVSKLFLIMGVYQANCQVSKNGLRLLLRVRMAELWAFLSFWPLSGMNTRIHPIQKRVPIPEAKCTPYFSRFISLLWKNIRIGPRKNETYHNWSSATYPFSTIFSPTFSPPWRKCSGPEFRGDAKWDSSLWNHAFSVTYVPRFISLREKLVFGSFSANSEAKMPRREIRGDSKYDFGL